MLVFLSMKEIIEQILLENIPDAVCKFYGESCNLRLEVSSKTFANMPLIANTTGRVADSVLQLQRARVST